MSLSDAFFGHHGDVQLLVFAEQHHFNWVFFLSLRVCVLHWNHRVVRVDRNDVFRSDLDLVTVFADGKQFEVDGTLVAHLLARAFVALHVVVNLVADQRNQPEPVSDELVVQC